MSTTSKLSVFNSGMKDLNSSQSAGRNAPVSGSFTIEMVPPVEMTNTRFFFIDIDSFACKITFFFLYTQIYSVFLLKNMQKERDSCIKNSKHSCMLTE